MNQALHARGLWSIDALSSSDAHTLLTTALAFKRAKSPIAPLKGKHLALLCEHPRGHTADVYTAAATGLGAQVTRIRPSASRLNESSELRDTARVLGRLYDAIECDGMGEALMLELARAAAIPVSNVLMHERHPIRLIADLMTMQEVGARPARELTMCVVGDEQTPWCQAWRQMAALTGVGVLAGRADVLAAEAARAGPGIAFVCDPQGPRCADGQPALLAVARDDARSVSLARRQVTNHRFVVQALLTHTLN